MDAVVGGEKKTQAEHKKQMLNFFLTLIPIRIFSAIFVSFRLVALHIFQLNQMDKENYNPKNVSIDYLSKISIE